MKKKKLDFIVDNNGCFIVTSHRPNKDGYCYMYHEGRSQRAHRLIYQECYGDVPEIMVIRHKCDVRNCVNPEHLDVGFQKDNMADRDIRLRNARGEKNGRSKITNKQARVIKKMISKNIPICDISRSMEVNYNTVWKISKMKIWKHIDHYA